MAVLGSPKSQAVVRFHPLLSVGLRVTVLISCTIPHLDTAKRDQDTEELD
jgi:hypothetical protein